MISLESPRFGTLEIPEDEVFLFSDGIPGFENLRRFCIIEYPEGSQFQWLQSLDEPDITFVMSDPFKLADDYRLDIPDPDLKHLEIENPTDCVISVILKIHELGKKVTANFKGPLVFNVRKRLAKQLILQESNYSTEHLLTA